MYPKKPLLICQPAKVILSLLFFFSLLGTSFAQSSASPPSGLENKERLADDDLAKKKEGMYFNGLPLVNSDPDTGVGYGIRVYAYENGDNKDPYFPYTPYRHRLYVQYFATTGGYQYHEINYDAPYIMDSMWRIRSAIVYERDISKNFFGIDSRSLGTLTDRKGEEYSSISDYLDERRLIYTEPANGNEYTDARYHKYDIEKPNFNITGEHDFVGGVVRLQVGFMLRNVNINDYSFREKDYMGNPIKGFDENEKDVNATNGKTLLREQYEDPNTEIIGFNGGWANYYKFGIAYDTRDFEPDPKKGWFIDATVEATGKYNGSDFSYTRNTISPRYYLSPISSYQDLTFAGRGVYTFLAGQDIPFFDYNNMSFTEGDKGALGGVRSVRGFTDSRFVGKAMSVLNFEIRLRFYDFDLGGQNFKLIFVPFIDYGSVFNDVASTHFDTDKWKLGYGAGLRIAWNQATIIMADYGISEEGTGLYINFSHIF